MVETMTIPTRWQGDVVVKVYEGTESVEVSNGRKTLSVSGDDIKADSINDGEFHSAVLWADRDNRDNQYRVEMKFDPHVWRRLDVWLSHRVSDHTAE